VKLLVAIIAMLLLAVVAGRHTKRIRFVAYWGIILIALAQMSIVLYEMFIMEWHNP
jgi:hypothetical protein